MVSTADCDAVMGAVSRRVTLSLGFPYLKKARTLSLKNARTLSLKNARTLSGTRRRLSRRARLVPFWAKAPSRIPCGTPQPCPCPWRGPTPSGSFLFLGACRSGNWPRRAGPPFRPNAGRNRGACLLANSKTRQGDFDSSGPPSILDFLVKLAHAQRGQISCQISCIVFRATLTDDAENFDRIRIQIVVCDKHLLRSIDPLQE